MALNFIINAGSIIPIPIELGVLDKNAGGSVPHLALWDVDGTRIGQYKGDANGHVDDGDTATYTVYNTQNGDKPAQPDYLSLSMQESDALCITMIFAQGRLILGSLLLGFQAFPRIKELKYLQVTTLNGVGRGIWHTHAAEIGTTGESELESMNLRQG
ncbi:MAG: hypothetical protein Q9227_009343 [Pyrenula ochraceoflavens]